MRRYRGRHSSSSLNVYGIIADDVVVVDMTQQKPIDLVSLANAGRTSAVSPSGPAETLWREMLRGIVAATPLWFDQHPGNSSVQDRTARSERRLSREVHTTLSDLAEKSGVSMGALAAAAWGLALSRQSGEDEVLFGAVGPGWPTRPVRVFIEPDKPLLAVARAIDESWRALDKVEVVSPDRIRALTDIPSGAPFYHTLLVIDEQSGAFAGHLPAEPRFVVRLCASRGEGAELCAEFDATRLGIWAVDQALEHFALTLEAISLGPDEPSSTVSLLSKAGRDEIERGWNVPLPNFLTGDTIHIRFQRQVAKTPDAIALEFGEERVTYAELDKRSNALAHELADAGVTPGQRVALCLDRSPDLIIAILGILKAGAAYVPLDPKYPSDRLGFVLEDTQVPVVLVHRRTASTVPAGAHRVIEVDGGAARWTSFPTTPPAVKFTDESVAYVLFTSGSTGKPKGCLVSHRNVVRLMDATYDWFKFNEKDVWTLFSSCAFDFSVWEMWGALLYGGRLVVVPFAISRSPEDFCDLLVKHGVTVLNQTPSAFFPLAEVVVRRRERELALRWVVFGGEALEPKLLRPWYEHFAGGGPTLVNMYGITETTVHVTYRVMSPADLERRSVIGVPIPDLRLYILDSALRPVPVGVPGEIFVGGAGVTRGYLNRAELTEKRFIQTSFSEGRLYRSGDVARWLPDGDVEYIGRADTQVKVSGFRIELGEIETRLAQTPTVQRAVVTARPDSTGTKRLVAYLVAAAGAARYPTNKLRTFLREKLPEHMVPPVFVWVDSIPLTVNGKADIGALPAPPELRPRELETVYAPAESETERALVGAWEEVLGVDGVGVTDNFFELGGDSRQAVRAVAVARDAYGLTVPIVAMFESPTIRDLAVRLGDANIERTTTATAEARESARRARGNAAAEPIAIIGMACRFPGARNVDEFWHNLREGIESITVFDENTLDPGVRDSVGNDPRYVKARGVLPDTDKFDAAFFGIVPREAQLMDPQQRFFLEVAWETLEHAGYVPDTYPGLIGVFGGVYTNSFASTVLSRRPDVVQQYGEFNTTLLNEKDFVATRTAHKLGLTGPALSIHTACSTSLVAVCQAVESLRAYQSDIALAGGVTLSIPTNSGYFYEEGGMLSSDGHTKTFDAKGTGTVFSDGAGIVALKRLSEAKRDGDTIYAVIRGAALNNDGAKKASFTAPSVAGQAAVITAAQANAGVDPRTISYVEAHGTATPLGDPIEFQALTQAFRGKTGDTGFCHIGSVKSNIGHTVVAAGTAGLIKAALALTHDAIPPSLHFTSPNPNLDFGNSPFIPTPRLQPWPRGEAPRRAAVSSFGVGGTNAHVVLEEPPAIPPGGATRPAQVLVLSARTRKALDAATENLARHLREHSEQSLADIAYTLQIGRKSFAHRRSLACTTAEDAAVALETSDDRRLTTRQALSGTPKVAFMFPGQGSQYAAMGSALYEHEPVFRDALDRCATLAQPVLGLDLREILYAATDPDSAAAALRQTSITQPALFAIEYALATLWQSWGIQPHSMIGHSVGEFVGAVIAGVFSLENGMRLVAERGRMMQALPGGSMVSVRMPADQLAPRLGADLSIASDNAPSLCVVSGPFDSVAALQAQLEGEGIFCRLLQTSHAFHSSMMEPVIAPFAEIVRSIPLSAPRIPFVSSVTGQWITAAQAQDPMYWASHLRNTVRFADGVATLMKDQLDLVLLEVGPRATLSTLARQQLVDKTRQICVSSLGNTGESTAESVSLLAALGEIWTCGVSPDWSVVRVGENRRRVPLPTYPFERQRHWVDPLEVVSAPGQELTPPSRATAPAIVESAAIQLQSAAVAVEPPFQSPISQPTMPSPTSSAPSRRERLAESLRETLEQISGLDIAPTDSGSSFVELGFDSLVLTQVAMAITKAHGVKITFRQLLEVHTTLDRVVQHLDHALPAEPEPTPAPAPATLTIAAPAPVQSTAPLQYVAAVDNREIEMTTGPMPAASAVQQLIEQQLRLMTQQLALLSGTPTASYAAPSVAAAQPPILASIPVPAQATPPAIPVAVLSTANGSSSNGASANAAGVDATKSGAGAGQPSGELEGLLSTGPKREVYDAKKAFGAAPRITLTGGDDLTPKQRARLDAFIRRYTSRTKSSKHYTQEHRQGMADPRVASGFRPMVKELVYPLVMKSSLGSRMWDLDGNEYLDVLSGFGSNLFGWRPQFVVDAVKAQLDVGFEVGPQHPLAGEVAKLFCEYTGTERAAFCNTGSEAVLGAMRIARTVTGRSTIVIFTGSYHGINDEVIVRGTKKLRSIPAAPGILPSTAENVLVLDYGTPESLEIIRSRAHEIAAVIVEPVQSRRPDFQPKEFLQELRKITSESGAVYIWDEIITGFRVAPGGAQEHFGIRGDLGTYGKVLGGGIPFGVIAGKREYMDALDGGFWQFGDNSVPEVGVTYFAGTFVRHPLALAAAHAVLLHLREQGPSLQRRIAGHAERLQKELNEFFVRESVPLEIRRFSSLWKTFYTGDHQQGDLLFYMLRDRGIHIMDGFPCFMTAAHTDADVDRLIEAFKDSVAEMRESGFLPGGPVAIPASAFDPGAPPLPGARLGRDRHGSPAWYVPNASEPGKFVQLESPIGKR
jgi:amino acid adenylation domain-containing protein